MAGYSGTPLPEKLGIEEGSTVGIFNAPNYFNFDLGDLPDDVTVHRTELPADIFLIFSDRLQEAERGFQRAITMLPADGSIWIAWPKKSSGVDTDITEQELRDVFLPTGLVDNKVAAIDETWSGLRFVVRKENRDDWMEIRRRIDVAGDTATDEIRAVFEQYKEALNRLDAENVARWYGTSSFVIQNGDIERLGQDERDDYFADLLKARAEQGDHQWNIAEFSVSELADNGALAKLRWICRDPEGSVISDYEDTYVLGKGEDWEILGHIVHS